MNNSNTCEGVATKRGGEACVSRSSAGTTFLTRGHVDHVKWRGIVLTPKIEVVATEGGVKAKTSRGVPIVKTDSFGNIVWALPGGGEIVL